MSDTGRLLAAFETGALLRPATHDANLVDLALAFAHVCGVEDCELTPGADRISNLVSDARHLVLVLIDGFGMNVLEREPSDSVFRQHVCLELRTVFPSSTAPALTSLATGLWPAEHAVPGWWVHLPDAGLTATILPFVERFSERTLEGGVDVHAALPAPTLMGRYRRQVARIMPAHIEGSVYSRYATPAAFTFGYRSLSTAVDVIESRISGASEDTLTYLYIPFIDAAAHEHGPESRQARDATRRVRERIGTLVSRLRGRARIVVTADHGGITGNERARHVLDRRDALMEHLEAPPSCEPRAPAFHARHGREEAFASLFRRRFGEHFVLLTVAEADSLRLFGRGAMTSETRSRLGTHVGIAVERDVLLYEPAPTLAAMKGFHGGLLPDEMRVPLIVA